MQPLTLIPWTTDFMAALADLMAERGSLSDTIVLFPHNRPRRHLKPLLRDHPAIEKPVFMPEMISIADFIGGLHKRLAPVPPVQANQLDLVSLLHGVVSDIHGRPGSQLSKLPELDIEQFLAWGMPLAGLMDDLLRQDVTPQDLDYMEGEVSPYAAALLGHLGDIQREYLARLEDRGWATAGLAARFVTGHMDEVITRLKGKTVLAAGFYALSGSEDALFKALWQEGILHPLIHGDPALADDAVPHWSAAEHAAWLTRWRTKAIIPPELEGHERTPEVRFCEGYDRHSQLARLEEDMLDAGNLAGTAVILPDEGALLPVLHHLPEKDPNISMGYPLGRTSLARLVETLLSLQENRHRDGRYYWRDVINLIRHPYLRLLGPEDAPLRTIFQVWEGEIRQGEKFIDVAAWEPPYTDESLEGVDRAIVEPLLRDLLAGSLDNFENTATLADLADALTGLAELLHASGERLWHNYLIDAECLFRLTTSVIPQLKGAEASHEPFSRTTQYAFLRRMLSMERVSFEPDPIAGLQVLGVLETRLLHFNRLFVLDAIEERLPGTNPYDPLLPDPLRNLLGLPDSRERDNVSGYNFYRLLMGADEAVIYYQDGVQPGQLDQKAVRSRFVEQLLWEREQKQGRAMTPEDGIIDTVTFPASPIPPEPPAVTITAGLGETLLNKLTSKGLSPSSLDRYMNCPKQFFFDYLTGVRPVKSVEDDTDRSEFGSLIHEVLTEFLTPYVNVETELGKLDPTPLTALFSDIFKASPLYKRLSLDGRMGLMEAGRYRLTEFLAGQQTATLLGLEKEACASIEAEGVTVPIKGRLDRVEQRDGRLVILDYKTGNAPLPRSDFWDDMELRDRMETFDPDVVDTTLLADIASGVRSVQVPAYVYLHARSEGQVPDNAGLVNLGDNGKEQLMFGRKWTDEECAEATGEIIPLVIRTIVTHMLRATRFEARTGKRCQWCDFKTACGR
ncbi:PD-(D/E)XK nuclease family protein [Pseudodesulfovibrio portus]|uniref:PD-(D/E)XK endonuclease-like domain-containing protein n=1 Tax=Pseudodesulfovibrio portus TaxID=231439 RepID=A0ABM8AVX3_9BACT|nr:PD-(D/E)XK nuclease family protein [Pseudodesulfovibrio portus]BDQ35632.1 hypothetical protein JCM14722_31740 [Pseudodesulfovibrio portus]